MTPRMATPADIETITALRLKMLEELAGPLPADMPDITRAYLQSHLPDGSCLCALMEVSGAVIAMAMLCIYTELPDELNAAGKSSKLTAVYTLPEHRGKGHMERLLRQLIAEGKARGVKSIYAAAERKAMPLYQRVGFLTAETILYMDL